MRKILPLLLAAIVGHFVGARCFPPRVAEGGVVCSSRAGDSNADGKVDLADAITILGFLFQGSPAELVPLCAAPGGGGLPTTGQTDCASFDPELGIWVRVPCAEATCPGQDGALRAGCSSVDRFLDQGDGTLLDTCTGLQWLQDSADVNGDGQVSPAADALVWCEALNFCEALDFAGHSDWRLPNIVELQSIVDYGRASPSIDPTFNSLDQYYWSSTTHSETPDNAWGIGFSSGYVGVRMKTGDIDFSFNFVRAVRGP